MSIRKVREGQGFLLTLFLRFAGREGEESRISLLTASRRVLWARLDEAGIMAGGDRDRFHISRVLGER